MAKCKTVLKIKSRCNEDVWNIVLGQRSEEQGPLARRAAGNSARHYLAELCRAHLPVVNKVVQAYRLATYDYFPHEVSPWDVPFWIVERNAKSAHSHLVPYREWDDKPRGFATPVGELMQKIAAGEKLDPPTLPYEFIERGELQSALSTTPSAGEFELLDSINLMERGDYSGAIRRISTALEVVVESVVGRAIETAEGKRSAVRFLKSTELNFRRRVEKYEQLSERTLSTPLKNEMFMTRKLRHRIVHRGYRIASGERGRAQRAVDTGRWIYNWFENNRERANVTEGRIAFRSLGRDIFFGIFPSSIRPDGVVISMYSH